MNKYALGMISPFSIGRGDGFMILNDILSGTSLSLVRIRQWVVCDNSWKALQVNNGPNRYAITDEAVNLHSLRRIPSWILLFKSDSDEIDPHKELSDFCGMGKYSLTTHPGDNGVRVTWSHHLEYETNILFREKDLKGITF